MAELKGVFNIMATPFDESGRIDTESLDNLVEFQLKAGAAGLTILGIMGEFNKLTEAERDLVTERIIRTVNGRVPVVVGVTHTGTYVVQEFSRRAEALGVAGVMVAPPVNLRNLDAVFEFYRAVHNAVNIPVVVQDEPVTTGVIMPPSFLARLVQEFERCRWIKLEEAPVPPKITKILALAPQAQVFGGLGGQYFLQELQRGAVGTMTGFAFTELLVAIEQAHREGWADEARDLFYRHLPLISYEGQAGVGLAIRKEILKRRGAIRHAGIRAPGVAVDAAGRQEIADVLAYVGLQ